MKRILTASPMMILAGPFLLTGCFRPPVPVMPPTIDKPFFCDVFEPRRYTQEEIDVRAERWPANLRRDFANNATYDRECVDQEADK